MKKITTILHTDNSIAYTGAFKALLDFCNYTEKDFNHIVIMPKGSSCVNLLTKNNIIVEEIDFIEINKNPINLLLYFPKLILNGYRLFKIAKKYQVDIYHSNDLYNLSLYLAKFFYNKPIITHVRMRMASFPSWLYKMWRYFHLNFANQVVAVSNEIWKDFNYSKSVEVVYDIAPVEENYPEYKFTFEKDSSRPFQFIYLSNFIKGKGQDLAIKALHLLVKLNPKVHVTFCGGDMGVQKNVKYKNELLDLVKELNLSQYVTFEGFVEDVEFKLKQYDASLNFSLSESFSMVSYESLLFGIPLISSDCGGPRELFEDQKSGILVGNGNINEMMKGMLLLSQSPEMCLKISMNSKMHIQNVVLKNKGFGMLREIFLNVA